MISLIEFDALPVEEQFEHIEERGVFLVRKRSGRYIIYLLSVDTFFVEIWNDTNAGACKAITCFTDPAKLDFYLKEIPFSNFFS